MARFMKEGRGDPAAELVLLGGEPESIERGPEPFLGPSGHVLSDVLSDLGRDLGSCYRTLVVKSPGRDDVDWQGVLAAELADVSPDVVVTLGATATEALVDEQFSAVRGRVVRGRYTIVPTHHPAAASYSDRRMDELYAAMEKAFDRV